MEVATTSPASENCSQNNPNSVLWQIEIRPDHGQPDRLARNILADAIDLGLPSSIQLRSTRGFLIQGTLSEQEVQEIASSLLTEPVVESFQFGICGDDQFAESPSELPSLYYVLPLPGVTDPEAESTLNAIRGLGYDVEAVSTFCKYNPSCML